MIRGNIVLLYKQKGITSHKKINEYKRENNIKKIGHIGTLDPLAEGLLIALTDESTKLSDTLMKKDKIYEVEMQLGYETDTLDSEGKIINSSDNMVSVSQKHLEDILKGFLGEILQKPPMYSAIKIDGEKMYNLARKNINIDIPNRKVFIHFIDNIEIHNDIIKFRCKVSSGTYIRSLVRDIGYKLNSFATMTKLKRTHIGEFSINDDKKIYNVDECIKLNSININQNQYKMLVNGMTVVLDHKLNDERLHTYYNNKYIGIVNVINNSKIKRSNYFVSNGGNI